MKYSIVALLLVISSACFANEIICPKVESRGEGHWPLPPAAFTSKRYEEAIHVLNTIAKDGSEGIYYDVIENALMHIKGYMLKLYGDKELFCEFIENEAYVIH